MMSEIEAIRETLQRTARRRRLWRGLAGLWKGLLAGAVLMLVTVVLYKLTPIPPELLMGAGVLAAVAAVAGFAAGWFKPLTLMETARWVDGKKGFQERLSTALEMADAKIDDRWRALVVGDAAARLQEVDAKQLMPFSLTKASRWALLILAVTAGLGFVPEYRSKEFVQKKKDSEIIRETGRQLTELTRRTLQEKPPAMEPARKALESVSELGEHFAKAQLTRSEALRDLASATQKLKDQAKDMSKSQAFKTLERATRASSKGGSQSSPELQKQMEALQQQMANASANPDALDKLRKELEKAKEQAAAMPDKTSPAHEEAKQKLQQALADLAKQSREMGASLPQLDEAIAALAESQPDEVVKDLQAAEIELEKLRDMAKTMQKLQMQMDKLGKDLAEQLENGQAEAAQSTLRQMAQKLEGSKLTPEQLKQMMEEVAKAAKPGREYGELGELLKTAAKQMANAEKAQAGESLKQAADALDKMMSEMSDAQSILSSLEAMQRAQMAIGNGQGWANTPRPGRGAGRDPNGQPGRGVGTWHDEDSWMYPEFTDKWDNSGIERPDMDPRGLSDRGEGALADNLVPTKVKGQMTPGGPMPSVTMKGVNIKGMSKVDFKEMVTSAQSEAQGALSQDQVPRAYQGAVKDYFNDLK